jgi:ubiquinone/menaquinone biosynthesis C-methylase UbiE
MKSFWDFCAPFYDFFERRNGAAYAKMLKATEKLTPEGAVVFEAACGTAEIGIAVSKKAKSVLCTDLSESMLKTAEKKIKKLGIKNIGLSERSIYETGEADGAYDIVIASQVLHLIDEPKRAADELRRICRGKIIMPLALTEETKGTGRFYLMLYKLVGFRPKRSFDKHGYKRFIKSLGFENVRFITISGSFPIMVAVAGV